MLILEQSHVSKARKMKKKESETLPQVSEEICYDIAADFKDLLEPSRNKPGKKMRKYLETKRTRRTPPQMIIWLRPLPENNCAGLGQI